MASASFFFNDTATTEIYTLSLHDALPISVGLVFTRVDIYYLDMVTALTIFVAVLLDALRNAKVASLERRFIRADTPRAAVRSEEHTSELQSRQYLVCRLLLEKQHHTSSTT